MQGIHRGLQIQVLGGVDDGSDSSEQWQRDRGKSDRQTRGLSGPGCAASSSSLARLALTERTVAAASEQLGVAVVAVKAVADAAEEGGEEPRVSTAEQEEAEPQVTAVMPMPLIAVPRQLRVLRRT